MDKPKLQIIVLFQNLGDKQTYFARSPAPPLSGALVAGLTPPIVEVELLHEMVRPIDYHTDADFIALSFMDFCAPHAIEVARKFKKLGKVVVAGGRYPSTFPEHVIPHMDSVVVGEAECVWPQVVEDMVKGKLKKVYEAPMGHSLENIPPPRYDLIEPEFAVPVVTEATRGCKYRCSFCQLTVKPAPFRLRPIEDVIRDLTSTGKLPFYKRRMAMLLDNNLGGDMAYAKELLKEIAKLKLWGLGTQFSFDCLQDDEFVDLLCEARCTMAFIGMESLNEPSLSAVHKRQNKVEEYKELFMKLKKRGILTFTGLMLALDEDTADYYRSLPERLDEIDPSSILTSISIPIPGTPFHDQVERDGRIVDRDLSHYEGDHLVFEPKRVSPEEVFEAFQRVNKHFYSWKNILRRWWRFVTTMRPRGNLVSRMFRRLVMSFVLFKLSIFQRDHAQKKVYPVPFQKHEIRMKEETMSTRLLIQAICIVAIASLGQISCSHIPEKPKALSNDIGVNLGAIGVVSARYGPNIQLREPMDKGTGALSGAGASTLSLLQAAGSMGQAGIILLPFIPIAALGGAIAGGSTGVPREKVEEARASIETAIRDLHIQETLQDQIMGNVREKTTYPLVRVEGRGPVSPEEKVSYQSLSGDLDSILEISVTSCNLEGMGFKSDSGLGYINSDLWLSMDTRVRLVRVADDREIFNRSFTTRCYGQRLKFLEWGANDATPLKQEVANCLASMRERIVKDFLAPSRDLTGKWMLLYQICTFEGCEISGNFIVWNAGNLDAQASLIRFYLSEDTVYDEGRDTLLKEVTTKSIEGGESQLIRLDYRLSQGQDARRKYVITIIDGENVVTETDKTNNQILGRIE